MITNNNNYSSKTFAAHDISDDSFFLFFGKDRQPRELLFYGLRRTIFDKKDFILAMCTRRS